VFPRVRAHVPLSPFFAAASGLARGCRDKPSRRWRRRTFGFWALAPRTSRSLRSTGPAIAFARRADAMHGPLLPWAFAPLSGLRNHRPPVSTSGAFPPGLFARPGEVSAAFRGLHRGQACPWALWGARRLVVPAGVPNRTDSLCEVFAPSAGRRRLDRAHRIASVEFRPIVSACRRDGTSKRGFSSFDVPSFRD